MQHLQRTARLTGVGYLLIFLTGFFANFFVLESLVVPGDPETTLRQFTTELASFRMGLVAFFAMVIVDLILAWPLYTLLRQAGRNIARLSSGLRAVNAWVFFVALSHLVGLWQLPSGLSAVELQTALDQFTRTWNWGLLVFGGHLLLLGFLLFRAAAFPKLLGVLVSIAGLGYLIDCSAQLWLPSYASHQALFETMVVSAGVLGEFSLTLWLLIKGIRTKSKPKVRYA